GKDRDGDGQRRRARARRPAVSMRSMTGYGAGAAEARGARVTVEIRGLNQRFLDVKVAVPREYAAWETEIRDRVRKTAQRGRVEVTVLRAPIAAERRYRVAMQPGLARAYVGAVRELVQTLRLTGGPSLGDVTEEIVRLESHLAALASALGEQGPVGKRIDFLVQEVHRELNTTGAKAGDLTITDLVLAAKSELEKLREQVQNVE